MRKAAVIGGGAAGMMTAVLAAGEKTEIHLECGDKPEISVQLRLQL